MFSKLVGVAVMAVVFSSPFSTSAQEPVIEYGQASELQGVAKVFVDTGADLQQRNLIARELRKRLPHLEVVSQPEETDIHLRFFLKETSAGKTDWVGTVVKVVGSNRVRVLLSYKDETPPVFATETLMGSAMEVAKPHMFVMHFVKVYKKANGGSKV
jgi:hypothetical protein